MERESFESQAVANVLNESFVSSKASVEWGESHPRRCRTLYCFREIFPQFLCICLACTSRKKIHYPDLCICCCVSIFSDISTVALHALQELVDGQ